ncbi:hypothetical protein PGIGA_G00041130 [Pangasianodon gigas]|uniref:Uncharacterized protein n=1 Tax=Pangasianodon gigas TaxID=30993 RepID=A0ACC5X272_PANGG|nr:hypothetical protein [Pangasianodon gigas]
MASHGLKSGLKADVPEENQEYVTPSNYELGKLLARSTVAYTHVNEVWPNIFIGDEQTARNRYGLQKLGVTHVLNAAEGERNSVCTGAGYYSNMDIEYYGIEAEDIPSFNISVHFFTTAEYMRSVLSNAQNRQTARNRYGLQKLGVTHVLNAAEGERNSVCTGAGYYSNMDIEYYGIEAEDIPSFNISVHFFTTAEYMRSVLSNAQNKLLVHCVMGRSRSATLVLAYLMIEEKMTLVEAIEQVKRHRQIIPNWGFLKQLRELDAFLLEQRSEHTHTQTADGTERTKQ